MSVGNVPCGQYEKCAHDTRINPNYDLHTRISNSIMLNNTDCYLSVKWLNNLYAEMVM